MVVDALFKRLAKSNPKVVTERDVIKAESKIGGKLFGPVPQGHRREFFCLDEYTWIWYEQWKENGQFKSITTRYEVRSGGILKKQDNQPYHYIEGQELHHLAQACRMYYQQVGLKLYGITA